MLFHYYGVDWLAMTLTFLAIYLLGNKSRSGFVVMMAGNASWFVLGLLTASVAMLVANAVFFAMNVRGFWRWSRPEASD
ncbi:MAG: nicotinamide mononucleotide transporter [Planctomycetota bacterium]